jgi:hypothetical protein
LQSLQPLQARALQLPACFFETVFLARFTFFSSWGCSSDFITLHGKQKHGC